MPVLASSATRRSTIVDSPVYYTMNCTGLTFLNVCSTRCVQWFTDVCSKRHHSIWKTAASIPQTSLISSTCGPPAVVSCLCRDTAVQCSVIGLFLWPARQPGTRYQTIFEIRCVLLTVFVVTWKLFCSRSTSIHSTLGALRLCAIQIYYWQWHWHWHYNLTHTNNQMTKIKKWNKMVRYYTIQA